MSLKIINTSDGSHTIYNSELNETYHSVHGSIKESLHVYVEEGLNYFQKKTSKKVYKIFEVGFGTGLNFVLSYLFSEEKKITIDYHSIEPYPLTDGIIKKLNYFNTELKEREIYLKSHSQKFNSKIIYSDFCSLRKEKETLEEIIINNSFDIIYFDAFAPSKQPSMWTLQNLNKIFTCMSDGSILVTYCSSGKFKRDLKEIGFNVEIIPGPLGKKEMVRATK